MLTVHQIVWNTFFEVTGREVSCCSTNLFAAPNYYTPRDLAYVFLALRSSLNIDINYIYHRFKNTTFDQLVFLIENSKI